jgi:hypothetical protein
MPSDRSLNRADDGFFLVYLFAFFAAWTICGTAPRAVLRAGNLNEEHITLIASAAFSSSW